MIRIGHSTDIHRLEDGEQLIIGGVKINHHKGSVGHSDADCLYHSVAESLMGALALGDLGKLYPDTSIDFKDMDSSYFVRDVMKLVKDKGYVVNNIDNTIYLQKPKLQDYIFNIRENIASLLEIDISCVSVKATTGEKVGIVGREEAIVTESVVLLISK